ncbi:hypothetical protein T484DRAFT_1924553 [Baffinella frigidus]|nr:hypothetical protein T484DRAFT_1924553 [Cryptophyta sp. CCMP2293]
MARAGADGGPVDPPEVFAKHSMLPVSSLEAKHGPLDQVSKKVRRTIRESAKDQERLFNDRLDRNRNKFGARTVTRAEAAEHCRRGDLWLVIAGVVYNATEWIGNHPGGPKVLLDNAGKDVSTLFKDMGHSLLARYQLADFYVGDLPMVECVNESDSNSEEESSDESDEEEDAGFVKVKSSQPARQEVSNASDYKAPLDRIVPNRYRRKNPPAGADSAEPVFDHDLPHDPRTEAASRPPAVDPSAAPPSKTDTLRWWLFAAWRIATATAARVGGDVWGRRHMFLGAVTVALLALLASHVPIPASLLGHSPEQGAAQAPGATQEPGRDAAGRAGAEAAGNAGGGGVWAQPPEGHDPNERLYF